MRTFLFLLAIMLCQHPTIAHAEVLTWICDFEKRVTEEGVGYEKMRLTFKVDTLSHKAVMEGNVGLVDVSLHIGDDAFSFSELVGSGSVQTTTITRDGLAVHSRNTVMLGEIVAAQHHGRCTTK